ncbi:DUF262 domain-containing protein [Aeromicrobium stalagmiti]|uniref:DUF262 domain-containing protein n=1 Tax=Aeromicrobium stalagmiti TaxID=2738988 RepID=UPI00156A59B5|nr:DUF262 domain-containing protein [Aeromicrobium stalagmiti]NRQ50399.1 DUF262 domain-containing protein [Aeromicrobium stalagmiti]
MTENLQKSPPWSRDELVLALDLYRSLGGTVGLSASNPAVIELSTLLRHLPVFDPSIRSGPSFRSPSSVALKLHNFASIDPTYAGAGMANAGAGDTWAWHRWSSDETGRRELALAVRTAAGLTLAPTHEAAEAQFEGGQLLYRLLRDAEKRPASDPPDALCRGCDAYRKGEIPAVVADPTLLLRRERSDVHLLCRSCASRRDVDQLNEELRAALEASTTATAVIHERNIEMSSPSFSGEGRHVDGDAQSTDASVASDLQEDLVQLVVDLSRPSATPIGVDPASQVDSDAVDFRTNGWLASIVQVQGWLNLGTRMVNTSPMAGIASLASALDPLEDLIDPQAPAERPQLTDIGMELLHARCERALDLKHTFSADLESEDSNLDLATAQWFAAWEDIADDEDEEPTGPFVAKANQWSINTFASRAARGELDLAPSYQRADVWPTADAQLLIESVLRGIPLPSVIVLTPTEASGTYEIVDGKQRLTAILRFMGRHPTALRHVAELDEQYPSVGFSNLFRSDYLAFRKAYNKHTPWRLSSARERELQLPYRLRSDSKGALSGELKVLEGKYYTQVKPQRIWIAGRHTTVEDLFEIGNEYQIPVLEYSNATRRQIHEVFNLYNKQGKHLNAEEIRNAVYHNLDLMRGLLVASGDNPNLEEVAPFLRPISARISALPAMIEDYNVGTSRYKRTKLVCWIAASLLVDSTSIKGSPFRDDEPYAAPQQVDPNSAGAKSTAKLITELFDKVDADARHPLRRPATVAALADLINNAVSAHAACDAKDGSVWTPISPGDKWQELQLVATITGVALATIVKERDQTDALEDIAEKLRTVASTDPLRWQRPKKTQSRSQASYIGFVALNTMEMLGVQAHEADAALRQRFGLSGVRGHDIARSLHVWDGG